MTKKEFLSTYEQIIVGACVQGFRQAGQFPVLELWNDKENYKIEFHIDCRISSNNSQLNKLVNQFSKYDEDIYETIYFVGVNRKSIKSFTFSKDDNLIVLFSNDLELLFKLNDEWPEPFNISILKGDKYLKGCRLLNDGTIEE